MNLDDVALFARIVELGTLSAAARERNVPVSQVTRALARLEAVHGVRLLHRSTHSLSLSDEGEVFLAHAQSLLHTSAALQADLSGRRAGPSGWVRVSVSTIVAEAIIAPSLPALHAAYPRLQVDIAAEDRMVDMAREGIDVALRTGSVASEALVARRIGRLARGLYAAPAYARRHGLPTDVAALRAHRLIGYSAAPALNQWRFAGSEAHTVEAHARTDNTGVALALVRHGAGIGRIVDLVAEPLVARGDLLPVLAAQVQRDEVPVFAVMLQGRQRLPKVRACIDHWADWLAQAQKGAPSG